MVTNLKNSLRTITENSAVACYQWIGRGDKISADSVAVETMRHYLQASQINARIVVGEGEKDEAPLLYKGERFGCGEVEWDIAVDPLEGTTSLAKGLSNSMCVIALCEVGKMFDPGPSFYMEKFAGPKELIGKIDPNWDTKQIITETANYLAKSISEITVFVLDKPRHEKLVSEIYEIGAKVVLRPSGDVAGAVMAALPNTNIDILLGTGGTPEGLITAVAIKAIGGEFLGRINPQLEDEKKAVKKAGLNGQKWLKLDDLISTNKLMFSATGVTDGVLFDGIYATKQFLRSESLLLSGIGEERILIKSFKNK